MAQGNDGTANRNSVEYLKCYGHAGYFINEYCVIDDAHGLSGAGQLPFHLWPAQLRLVETLMLERLLIILKARQLGISWLCCAYALWLCLFQPGKVVLLFSKGQDEANELARRISVLYHRLPNWLKAALPNLLKDNTEGLSWGNESRVVSLPATQSAGRSFTASLIILDEFAFMQWADKLFTAAKPTIDAGGQMIVLSTANGLGNAFYQQWTRAASKLSGYLPVFLSWRERPGRDTAWYERQLREAADPTDVQSEYPLTPTEAFVSSGRVRFPSKWVAAQEQNLREPIPGKVLPTAISSTPGLMVYELPNHGASYVLGADVAEGLVKGDYSAAVVIDKNSWVEVATLHGHWEPDVFAGYIDSLARCYNNAVAGVERNNHGHAVLSTLKSLETPNVYRGEDTRAGWLTNLKTKPQIIDDLAKALRDDLITVRTRLALQEMQVYQTLDNGQTGAPEGFFDDTVMAWAIAVKVAQKPEATSGKKRYDGGTGAENQTNPGEPESFRSRLAKRQQQANRELSRIR